MEKNKSKILCLILTTICFITMIPKAEALDCTVGNCYCNDNNTECQLLPQANSDYKNLVDNKTLCGCPIKTNVDKGFDVCQNSGIVKVFQILGYVMFLIKIAVPLLLIGMGIFELGKAILASDDKAITNAIGVFVKRSIAGVVIFFIPTILSFAISIIDSADDLEEFECLSVCVKKPDQCQIPSDPISNEIFGE